MGPITAASIYLVIWWVVFLAVLPHGSTNYYETGETPPDGIDKGVPVNPNLKKKALVTTAISAVVMVIVYLVVRSGILVLPPEAQTY